MNCGGDEEDWEGWAEGGGEGGGAPEVEFAVVFQ